LPLTSFESFQVIDLPLQAIGVPLSKALIALRLDSCFAYRLVRFASRSRDAKRTFLKLLLLLSFVMRSGWVDRLVAIFWHVARCRSSAAKGERPMTQIRRAAVRIVFVTLNQSPHDEA